MPQQLPRRTSGELGAEADRAASHALEHDVGATAPHHPLEAVVAVLALEHPGLDELWNHLEPLHARLRHGERGGDARPRARSLEPAGEPGPARRRIPGRRGAVDERDDGEVAPPEGRAVEPGAVSELAVEIRVHAG